MKSKHAGRPTQYEKKKDRITLNLKPGLKQNLKKKKVNISKLCEQLLIKFLQVN